jgi:hypothetical protein
MKTLPTNLGKDLNLNQKNSGNNFSQTVVASKTVTSTYSNYGN